MTDYVIPVYSDQALTPRAKEVIRSIVDEAYPEHHITFRQGFLEKQVLVFGKAPTSVVEGCRYIYTYSIAQIMSKANAASVLTAALRQFITEPEPIYFGAPHYTQTAFEYIRWLNYLDTEKPIVIDIETDGHLGVDETPEEINVISVAVYQDGHPPMVIVGNWDALSDRTLPIDFNRFMEVMARLHMFKLAIYHNGKFDTRVLNRLSGYDMPVWFDTMLAHHVLNHAAGDHKLKTLARRYLGAPEWEADLSKYTRAGGHYEFIPTHQLAQYNGWDVYWTYKLYEFLAPQILADEDMQKAFLFEMEAAKFLLEVEKNGIPFDEDYSFELSYQQEQIMKVKKRVLQHQSWEDFNPGSPKQVHAALTKLGVDRLPNTKEETIVDLRSSTEHIPTRDFCDDLIAYRKAQKIKSTYSEGWRRHARSGRVHPTFLVHGTSTGRLSSTGPNAQNVPREKTVRKLVTLTDENS